MTRQALGRGLEALIPAGKSQTAENKEDRKAPSAQDSSPETITELPVARIRPNPRNPRHHIDEGSLRELEASIRAQGILQPLLVRPAGDYFEIIAGERRFLAAGRAGLAQVPVVVRELPDQRALEASLVENLQREDLDPIDEALGYQALMEDLGYTQDKIAERVGKDRTTVSNSVRLLTLPQGVQDLVSRGTLSAGHARALLALPNVNDIESAARYVAAMGLTVRKTEAFVARKLKRRVQSRRRSSNAPAAGGAASAAMAAIEEKLRRRYATQVRITRQGEAGKVEFEFYSEAELERLLELWGAL